jgi:hypothetical protein
MKSRSSSPESHCARFCALADPKPSRRPFSGYKSPFYLATIINPWVVHELTNTFKKAAAREIEVALSKPERVLISVPKGAFLA